MSSLLLGVLTVNAETLEATPTLKPPTAIQTPANPTDAVLSEWLSPYRTQVFVWHGADDALVGLNELITQAVQNHPLIAAARLKVIETEAKHAVVESKRVLFFFKYFDAQTMAGGADTDVEAAKTHVKAVEQTALNDTVAQALQLGEITLAHWSATHAVQRADRALAIAQQQFKTGTIVAFELNASQHRVFAAIQQAQDAETLRRSLSTALTLPLGLSASTTVGLKAFHPTADGLLDLTAWQWELPTSVALAPTPELVATALQKRPDILELAHRLESVIQLRKSSALILDRNQTKVFEAAEAGLKQSLAALKQLASLQVIEASQRLEAANQWVQLAEADKALAAKAYAQMKVSVKAGFNSDHELKDSQAFWDDAQAQWGRAVLKRSAAQVLLLYRLGLLTPQTLASLQEASQV
ncbi:MAG: hypothetical protein QE263_06965 [Vampirovibrionales bacterium]|nr:hypothetical protein [Vampirovibrionales bacterium]